MIRRLDIFAINQHTGAKQQNDLALLEEVVGAAQATLMVLDRDGNILTRSE